MSERLPAKPQPWWSISGEELLKMLRRVRDGEDYALVYAEAYANAEDHTNDPEPRWSLEDVQRVLYEIVVNAQKAYYEDHTIDNEIVRNRIEIGRRTLLDNNRWPGDGLNFDPLGNSNDSD